MMSKLRQGNWLRRGCLLRFAAVNPPRSLAPLPRSLASPRSTAPPPPSLAPSPWSSTPPPRSLAPPPWSPAPLPRSLAPPRSTASPPRFLAPPRLPASPSPAPASAVAAETAVVHGVEVVGVPKRIRRRENFGRKSNGGRHEKRADPHLWRRFARESRPCIGPILCARAETAC